MKQFQIENESRQWVRMNNLKHDKKRYSTFLYANSKHKNVTSRK